MSGRSMDDKLQEIMAELAEAHENNLMAGVDGGGKLIPNPSRRAIAQLKQVFADEGWLRPGERYLTLTHTQAQQIMTKKEWDEKALKEGWSKPGRHERINQRLRDKVISGELMTGAEWFSRFQTIYFNETAAFNKSSGKFMFDQQAVEAARRASGL